MRIPSLMLEFPTHSHTTAWFAGEERLASTRCSISVHEFYKYLVDIEEHPEVLPLAYDLVQARLDAARGGANAMAALHRIGQDPARSLNDVLRRVVESKSRCAPPW